MISVVENLLNDFDKAINAEGSFIEFTNESATPWTIDTDEYGGVRSGAIGHSSSTSISTVIETAGTLYFDYKVSSESNYDKLIICKNETSQYNQSGTVDSTGSIVVSVGDVITFTYQKDGSASSGSDCAWVRNVRIE